ncbi:MAG TPA: hypothetical protein VIJ14_09665 [Rhabdochlamydiaceae bacterium]
MFDTHMLNEQGKLDMAVYKSTIADAVKLVASKMPDGRDKSLFITKMEEGVFFGAKAIASKPGNFESKTEY